ncbi:segregation/condensation protein A [Clostridium felsineum]|uniref:Segregation and condensation protein A n=1 Tax=Clostridium felsineum TaxID=36839 RepID=A0A1S8L4L2_9CLOT|nr:segregation/condensation protein A [Clostridium felsineum]URZ06752.1 Segregation and condensation protein A [Clostridium felsineum]URZ11784.1 Segregation and condensation protein A [Clostridium felsineum]
MTLNINIDNFQGPFDLLLHLIKKNKMNIYEIKIFDITNQYIQYLNQMKEMDLEITSEFIVMAATLIEIKSKYLLPKAKNEEEEKEENDPTKELVSKLVEYKKFKAAAEFLKNRELGYGEVFSKKPEIIDDTEEVNNADILKGITLLDMYKLFEKLIDMYRSRINTNNSLPDKIAPDAYKIEDKMDEISAAIRLNRQMYFSRIINKCSNKIEVVVTFLALLELIKLKDIKVYQANNFKDIYIEETREVE